VKRETIRLQPKTLSKLINEMSVLRTNKRKAGCHVLCGHRGYCSGKEFDLKDSPLFGLIRNKRTVRYR